VTSYKKNIAAAGCIIVARMLLFFALVNFTLLGRALSQMIGEVDISNCADSRLAELEKLLANGLRIVCRVNVMPWQRSSPDMYLLAESICKGNKFRRTTWEVTEGTREMTYLHTFDGCYYQVYRNQTNTIYVAKNRENSSMWIGGPEDPTVMFFYLNTESHPGDTVHSINFQTVLQHIRLCGDNIRPGLDRKEDGAWAKLGPLNDMFGNAPKYTVYFSSPSSLWPSKLVKEIRSNMDTNNYRTEVINKGLGEGHGFKYLFPNEISITWFVNDKEVSRWSQIIEEVSSMTDADDSLFEIDPDIARSVLDLEIDDGLSIKTR
jgi:hypothetical protein